MSVSSKQQKQWNKECIESLELAKIQFITKGSMRFASHAIKNILDVEEFPSEEHAVHPVEEGKLLKAMFMCHAGAIEQLMGTVIRMIEDGILNADGDMAKKMADKIRSQMEKSEDESEEDNEEGYETDEEDDE